MYLLNEVFLDIEAYFSDLPTANWQTGDFQLVITCVQGRVAKKYIAAMFWINILWRKITVNSQEEKKSAVLNPNTLEVFYGVRWGGGMGGYSVFKHISHISSGNTKTQST